VALWPSGVFFVWGGSIQPGRVRAGGIVQAADFDKIPNRSQRPSAPVGLHRILKWDDPDGNFGTVSIVTMV
jgi:hypothetical protein